MRQQILTIAVNERESWTLVLSEIRSVRRQDSDVHIAPIGVGRIIHLHLDNAAHAETVATRIDFALAAHHDNEVRYVG